MPVSSLFLFDDTAGSTPITRRMMSSGRHWTRKPVDGVRQPEGGGVVGQDLGFDLLPAEAGAGVLSQDLLEELRRQVVCVFERVADRRDDVRLALELAQERQRPRRGGDDALRISPAQAELQVVPGVVEIFPVGQLIHPYTVVLRTAQRSRLVGRVGGGQGAVGPGHPAPSPCLSGDTPIRLRSSGR
jgi:hypothetical protein